MVFAGYDRDGMPFTEGEEVGECDAFTPKKTGIIRKHRCYDLNVLRTERAVGRHRGDKKVLVDMAFDTLRAYLASQTGVTLPSFLEYPVPYRDFLYGKHALSGEL